MNSGIMRGLGDSRTPLIFLFIACVINIVLDLVFVLVFSWGVFGVALATILAQICSWVFGIFYINRKYPFLHIRLFRMRLDRRLLGQVDFWLQAQPDSQEAAEYRRWLLDEMRDGR